MRSFNVKQYVSITGKIVITAVLYKTILILCCGTKMKYKD